MNTRNAAHLGFENATPAKTAALAAHPSTPARSKAPARPSYMRRMDGLCTQSVIRVYLAENGAFRSWTIAATTRIAASAGNARITAGRYRLDARAYSGDPTSNVRG